MYNKYYLKLIRSFALYYLLIITNSFEIKLVKCKLYDYNSFINLISYGGAEESRTPDLLLARQAL